VPASTNVKRSVSPLPSGQSGVSGWVGAPSSDHSYVQGLSGQLELVASSVTGSPVIGEAGEDVKLAVGACAGVAASVEDAP
jgi:hypothetical protein